MNPKAELGPHLRARLSYLLKRAFLRLEDLHTTHLAPWGINARELAVLLLLDAREPESQQQAAERLGVDRTTMVALLDGMEQRGLIERQADVTDRRRNVIVLTAAGHRTLVGAKGASDDAERELLGDLSETDARIFRTLLGHIAPGSKPEH